MVPVWIVLLTIAWTMLADRYVDRELLIERCREVLIVDSVTTTDGLVDALGDDVRRGGFVRPLQEGGRTRAWYPNLDWDEDLMEQRIYLARHSELQVHVIHRRDDEEILDSALSYGRWRPVDLSKPRDFWYVLRLVGLLAGSAVLAAWYGLQVAWFRDSPKRVLLGRCLEGLLVVVLGVVSVLTIFVWIFFANMLLVS